MEPHQLIAGKLKEHDIRHFVGTENQGKAKVPIISIPNNQAKKVMECSNYGSSVRNLQELFKRVELSGHSVEIKPVTDGWKIRVFPPSKK